MSVENIKHNCGQSPLVLLILDGWGLNPSLCGNAIAKGDTPNLDRLYANYPWAQLKTFGTDVGLTPDQMGDSNVGHMNIGAGRIVYQWLGLLAKAIAEGEFAQNEIIRQNLAASMRRTWHLLGLLSDGGVHSHLDHLVELLRLARDHGQRDVAIHAILDGRDVPPRSASSYLQRLQQAIAELGVGRIASIGGRYYIMDRDKRWERLQQTWQSLRLGEGHTAFSADDALRQAYARGESDEFVTPTLIIPEGQRAQLICDGDSLFCFNYRADRMRQLMHLLVDESFLEFDRHGRPQLNIATLAEYEQGLSIPFAFDRPSLQDTLGQVLASAGLRQLRLAETEKYAHVTFFFDGGVETKLANCDQVLVPSPKVATYDLQPEMSAAEITDILIDALQNRSYDVIIANLANGDMVGHTGDWHAALKAVACVDRCVGLIAAETLRQSGTLLITADHGNADCMRQADGTPHTAHTTSNAPLLLIGAAQELKLQQFGRLADIAPTILALLGIEQPVAMSGKSLLLPVTLNV